MEALLNEAAGYLWTQSLHVTVLFAAVAAVCWGLRRRSAHVRYLLWLLIVAKCLGPSVVTVSLAILPGQAEPAAAPEAVIMPMVIDVPASVQPAYAVPLPLEAAAAGRAEESLLARVSLVRPQVWAAVGWLIGAAFFAAVVVIKAVRTHRRIKRLRRPADAALDRELDGLSEGQAWRPTIWALAGTGQPFVWGVVRGSIYVPADFGPATGAGRRREILAHELAHVRRFDALVNALQTTAQAVFWFHPLVWIANRAIRAEREKCCDEAAIARLAASPRDYSTAIVETLTREYKSTLPTPSLAIAGPAKNIEDRIRTIMRPGKRFYRRPAVVAILAVLFLAAVITPTTIALTERSERNDRGAALEAAPEDVKTAIAGLRSADVNERAQAVMRLRFGKQGRAAAATPYLIDMLGDATPYPEMVLMTSSLSSLTQSCSSTYTFGSEAAETLARIGEKSDRLLDLLKSDNWRVRADAARAVGGLKDERAARRLISFVRDGDEHAEVRGNAALALGLLKDKRAVKPLILALNAEGAVVRKSAASALGTIGAASAAEPLAALLLDGEAEVRMAVIGALGSLSGGDVVPALLKALGDEHRQVREVAGRALARKPDGRALEALINALQDEYPNARATAAEALGELKHVRAVEPLLEALKDENAYVRWHAATALGRLRDGRAVAPLVAAAMQDEHIARIRAINALGELGGPRATEALIALLKDGDPVIRRNAADALTRMTGQRQGEDQGAWKAWWEANKDAAVFSADVRQVQIDLKLFTVASKEAFLKARLGIDTEGECLVLDDRQRQRLEDPTLSPSVIRLIAAPRVVVMDGSKAKIATVMRVLDADAEKGMPEIDVEITPHVGERGVLLEMSISLKSLTGRNDAAEPMVSVREIATSVTVGEGKSTLVELAGAGASTSDEAVLALITPVVVKPEREEAPPADKPFSVYGKVTDTAGNGLPGVEVRAGCGMRTLMPTGQTATDAGGRYVLHFGPGMRMSSRDGRRFNTGFQAATIHAGKDGLYEVNLCQQGNLAMSDMEDPSEHPRYKNYEGVVLPNRPYKLDFVMAPAAEIRGRLVDRDGEPITDREFWLDGEELYPSSSVFAIIKTDAEGRFTVGRVPLKKFWFSIRHENTEAATREIAFDRPGRYDIELAYEKHNGAGALQVKSIDLHDTDELRQRQISLERLRRIALAWCLYADEKGEVPPSLKELEPYLLPEVFSWAAGNVGYVAKAGTLADVVARQSYPIAYDKVLLQKYNRTTVAFADGHVEFVLSKGLSRYAFATTVPAAMVGTWFFDNAAGDDEQMAVFADGRVVVLYSNGHRDETRVIGGMVELAEYGGIRARMTVAEDVVLQRFVNPETGGEHIKPWKRIDAAPRRELLTPLTGPPAADAANRSIMIDMRFVTTPAGFLDESDLEAKGVEDGVDEQIAWPAGAETLFYHGPVDQLECTDLTARAMLLDNMATALSAMAQDYKGCSVIAEPRVMVPPGEPASIRIGDQIHYIGGFRAETSPGSGPQPITEVLEQGIKVLVTCRRGMDGAGHVLKLVVECTKAKGSEKRMFSGKYGYEVPRIERWLLDTGEGVSVPADETLVLICPRHPQADTAEVEYLIIMIKPTTVAPADHDGEE